jgi:diaminopimelate epimerase
MQFFRYHALGNDYIVMRSEELGPILNPQIVERICHRHYGIGSDGILLHSPSVDGVFNLRIFNPDGSEAEKSGNGLRIFARYLWDRGVVKAEEFKVQTKGGLVSACVSPNGKEVTVDMGRVSFLSSKVPVTGPEREVLREKLEVLGQEYSFCSASIGNPHCTVIDAPVTPTEAQRIGPHIENLPIFPQRTNVQLLRVIDRNTIQIEIWERGAGYTLASGSSSCAASAVAHRLGLVDRDVTVQMPGGPLSVTLSSDFEVRMMGPVTHIGDGVLGREAVSDLL